MRAGDTQSSSHLISEGGFSTPDRKARFIAPERPALREATDAAFPLRLNTGRLRDQWHSMTRSGLSPKLGAHRAEPFVEVHPLDAKTFGLSPNGYARISTRHGSCILKVMCSASQQPGSVFVPIHWNDSNASSARVGDLVAPCTDPFSGQPEAKATPAAIAPVAYAYRGLALSHDDLVLPKDAVWARVALAGASGIVFATNDSPAKWRDLAPEIFGDAVLTEYADRKRGIYRAAAFNGDRLEGALFIGPQDSAPQWSDLRGLIGGPGVTDSGPVVCACFGVGVAAIAEAITSRKATNAEEIGQSLRAGTKCGTCLPEIRSIVAQELHHDVAARELTHAH
jgi:assimilatory nitrate reductase catalytic subunit